VVEPFNYLYKKEKIQKYKQTSVSIKDTFTKVRNTHFYQIYGTYKGIPSPFLTYLKHSTYELDHLFNDEQADAMMDIRTMTIDHNYPLLQNLKRYKTHWVIKNSNGTDDDIEFISYACIDNDDYDTSCPMALGAGSQLGFSMSQSLVNNHQSQESHIVA
jgi:hypothetical protein